MSKTISEIYTEYKILPQLQEHMFRVTAVASLICDNLDEDVNKADVITACLLHDVGNIIKFNMNVMPEFFEPEGVLYWQKVKDEFIEKYGNNENIAHNKIAQELGVSERILELMNSISYLDIAEVLASGDFGKKIVNYCDCRVGPFGVVSLQERFMDLRRRYAYLSGDTPERLTFENSLRQIEKQLSVNCKINLENIDDMTVAPVISELKNFVVK